MPRVRSPGSESGFTLMELVLVILILGVAVLPLVTQMTMSSKHAADGHLAASASFLARERLEEALADRHAPARGYPYVTTGNYPVEATVTGFPGFSRTTAVSAESTYASINYKTVTVTVTSPTVPDVVATTWVVK